MLADDERQTIVDERVRVQGVDDDSSGGARGSKRASRGWYIHIVHLGVEDDDVWPQLLDERPRLRRLRHIADEAEIGGKRQISAQGTAERIGAVDQQHRGDWHVSQADTESSWSGPHHA